jgi:two-component system, LytTR family, response regulator
MRHRALLVDDERLARSRLRALLREHSEIDVLAEADCVSDALAAADALQPDVVFLDIQMPGQSGFEFLQRTRQQFHTIFVTAYEQYAIHAFDANGLDYLLKPVERERLGRAIARIPAKQESPSDHGRLDHSDYVFVTGVFGGRFVQVKDIQYIVAAGSYSEIVVAGQGKWMVLRSIKEWQERLPTRLFLRIHRSALVNLEFVERVEPLSNHSCHVFLRGAKVPLSMSRRYATMVRERMR